MPTAIDPICRVLVLSCVAMSWDTASGQTIADYSRSQRAVIEAEIARNNAKATNAASPALASPLPSFDHAASARGLPPLPAAAPRAVAAPDESNDAPRLVVSGVFVSKTRAVAEVLVEGASYMLTAGQDVPGTSWRVQSVSIDRVVLSGTSSKPRKGAAPTRVFNFPVTTG